jgi:hypothetical protein
MHCCTPHIHLQHTPQHSMLTADSWCLQDHRSRIVTLLNRHTCTCCLSFFGLGAADHRNAEQSMSAHLQRPHTCHPYM